MNIAGVDCRARRGRARNDDVRTVIATASGALRAAIQTLPLQDEVAGGPVARRHARDQKFQLRPGGAADVGLDQAVAGARSDRVDMAGAGAAEDERLVAADAAVGVDG